MRTRLAGVSLAIAVASGFGAAGAIGQSSSSRVDAHVAAAKVLNIYFLGQTEYSVWAVTTSAGTIGPI